MRFGEFELDSDLGELLRGGAPVEIRPKPLALLSFLVRHRDRHVSKLEVLDHVWPEVVVSDTALSSALKEARRALGDDGAEQRFIRTSRGRGYRFVHPVEEGPAEPAAPEAVEPAHLLFGRSEALERLGAPLDAALAGGRLHAVVLSGPAGIGKTRLAEDLLRRARDGGMDMAAAWCWEGEGAPAFWPWKQVLREIAGDRPVSELEAAFGAGVRRWHGLIDEGGGGSDEGSQSADGEESRFALFDAVASSLARAAAPNGLALLIDDLQWADAASLRLLRFVTRALHGAPLLLVCTVRTGEQSHTTERVSEALAALGRLDTFTDVALDTLDREAVATWAEAALGAPLDPAKCEAVWAQSGGNPLFLRHLLSHLQTPEGRAWLEEPGAAPPRVPNGIREFILSRLEPLGDDAAAVLRAGAVLGQSLQPDLVARAVDRPVDAVLRALDAAERIRLVTEIDAGSWRFAHGAVRDALLEGLPRAERARLHDRIGEAMEALRCHGDEGPWWELVHHFAGAASGDTLAKASAYAERAARQAARELAFEDAESRFRRALALLDASPEAADRQRRCELLLALGEAQMQASGRSPESQGTFHEAARIARELDAPELFARAALGYAGTGALVGMVEAASVELLEEALQRLPETPSALRVYVTTRLGFELINGTDRERARRLCSQAAELAGHLDDPIVQATALFSQAWDQLGGDDPRKPLAIGDRVLRLADESEDLSFTTLARNLRIRCYLELGDGARARHEVDALERWVEEKRAVSRRHHVHARRAMLALMEGRLDDVRVQLEAGERAREGVTDPAAGQVAVVLYEGLRREQGQLASFEPLLANVIEMAPQNWPWRCALADLYVQTGELERAAEEFERIIVAPVEKFPRDGNWHLSLALLAEVCAALGDVGRAKRLYELLLPSVGLCVVGGNAAICMGSLERRAGLLAGVMGRHQEALSHMERAVARNDALGARPEAARARLDQAELLLEEGRAGEAAARLREARGIFAPRSLPPIDARLAELSARLSG